MNQPSILSLLLLLVLVGLLCAGCERENFDVVDPFDPAVTPDTTSCALAVQTGLFGFLIVAEASDGVMPYSYLWSTEETAGIIEVPEPGEYTVTVTDALGCTGTATQIVSTPEACDEIVINIIQTTVMGQDVLIAEALNGIPPYEYSWGEQFPPGDTLVPPEVGEYEVLILDSGGCFVSQTFFYE